MADVTGGTPPTGASPFRPPEDIAAVYDHFGDGSLFAVANAAALPASGNWPGRTLMVQDLNVLYMWTGSQWIVAGLRPRSLTPSPTFFQMGRTTVTSDANGLFEVTFTTPFPNNCDFAMAQSGSPTDFYGGVAISGTIATKFSGRLQLPDGASKTIAIVWIAIGR
ncbi:hypothetical protein IC744_06685 [Microbacterium hominis]|uniref:gp53-like domain-containing protein n=1 Tax=Microbacterium TaxID=33882 RepID=UPI00168A867F|nr:MULTISPECIES: hypothetical protein [Microbacterium]QOC24845.1 hypothetical protein IC745_10670 [Microbacterium hominis]QOC26036.1 hypothetical protein IC745_01005 [Microbacterium hominis]QOC28898.1 hypothetical protein IC744_00020 [Microbacterium hominis]QOC30007.1 hypothetical protein IC744_06685 [Microbacterium hominis]QYF98443.1 hypothetical protein KY498_04150 [Microbacterium sp. PAMC21962]